MSTVLSVRVSDELAQNLDYLVKATDRSRAYLTNEALQEYITRNAWQVGEIHKALEEAKKGEFISHEAVGEWVKSMETAHELPMPEPDLFLNKIK